MSGAANELDAVGLRPFKRYPAYKDSGVKWLGEIPATWALKRLKRIVQFRGGGTPTKDRLEYWGGEIPWASPKDMKVSVVFDTEDRITAQAVRESATKLVPAGAVLVVVRSGILIHSIPVAVTGLEVTLNQDLKALIPSAELVPEYLMYLISGMQRELLVEWKKEGATVESLELELVASTPAPLPTIAEQCAIVTFLDRETVRIDALVEKKERLIELLGEKRTALITRAVTKGLDPNVPMKDSGVEWLGEIPAHWKVMKFAWLIKQSNAGEVIDRGYWDAGEGLLYSCQRTPICSDFDRFPDERRTEPGDLLVTRNGTPYVHLPEPGSMYTNVVQRVKLAPMLTTAFAWLALGEAAKSLIGFGDIIESFNMGTWRALSLPLPPLESQRQITVFAELETARIDPLVTKVREAIERLRELRTALISAAVTGKIDVSDAA